VGILRKCTVSTLKVPMGNPNRDQRFVMEYLYDHLKFV
jgi:hypothetical protein